MAAGKAVAKGVPNGENYLNVAEHNRGQDTESDYPTLSNSNLFPTSKLKDKFKSVWSTGFGPGAARGERNTSAVHRGETHDASLQYRGKGLRLRAGRRSEMVRREPDIKSNS